MSDSDVAPALCQAAQFSRDVQERARLDQTCVTQVISLVLADYPDTDAGRDAIKFSDGSEAVLTKKKGSYAFEIVESKRQ